ncbi:ATP-binding cassette domain-containing protein [Lactobacillus rossiae]|uniref:ATP-binding cassette domain-containing protein n=2 Tax=Furfurilactobacillus milii TaxID=2888272 RepID=A0A6N9I648_9LACO|nr:ATP-binding cassette domain-containing protein [Furfurilactobacillus milii]
MFYAYFRINEESGEMMTALLTMTDIDYRVGEREILTKINLRLEKESNLMVVGPSGSGKSTILQIMARMISPSAGQMTFDGHDAFTYDPMVYRRRVSYCFQQPTLFGKTVADNLNFPFEIRNQSVDEARQHELLAQVNLSPDYLNHDITGLSGGERQRVALIRNLIFVPDILLLDEVTTGLDTDNKAIVHSLVDHYRDRGGTVVWITHDESEIAAADDLYEVVAGKHTKEVRHA